MEKRAKILIIGFGSIGERHYNNLKKLGLYDLYVYDIDKNKISNKNISTIVDIDEQKLKEFDVAFICSPNNLHIKTAIQCAQANCYIFIEKPLSHNLDNIEELEKICKIKNLINMVACNMRFHPCMKFVKKYLDEKKLGKVYSIALETGYYLPYWRLGQDYSVGYGAKRETGGGIILDGGIHNFDLLIWLNNFNTIIQSKMLYNKISDLNIETEDNFVSIFEFKNDILGLVKGDYLQQSYSWNSKVVGENGNLEWDFKENIVWLKTKEKNEELFKVENYDTNQMYVEEIRYFLDRVQKKEQTFNNIEIAANTLKYCLYR